MVQAAELMLTLAAMFLLLAACSTSYRAIAIDVNVKQFDVRNSTTPFAVGQRFKHDDVATLTSTATSTPATLERVALNSTVPTLLYIPFNYNKTLFTDDNEIDVDTGAHLDHYNKDRYKKNSSRNNIQLKRTTIPQEIIQRVHRNALHANNGLNDNTIDSNNDGDQLEPQQQQQQPQFINGVGSQSNNRVNPALNPANNGGNQAPGFVNPLPLLFGLGQPQQQQPQSNINRVSSNNNNQQPGLPFAPFLAPVLGALQQQQQQQQPLQTATQTQQGSTSTKQQQQQQQQQQLNNQRYGQQSPQSPQGYVNPLQLLAPFLPQLQANFVPLNQQHQSPNANNNRGSQQHGNGRLTSGQNQQLNQVTPGAVAQQQHQQQPPSPPSLINSQQPLLPIYQAILQARQRQLAIQAERQRQLQLQQQRLAQANGLANHQANGRLPTDQLANNYQRPLSNHNNSNGGQNDGPANTSHDNNNNNNHEGGNNNSNNDVNQGNDQGQQQSPNQSTTGTNFDDDAQQPNNSNDGSQNGAQDNGQSDNGNSDNGNETDSGDQNGGAPDIDDPDFRNFQNLGGSDDFTGLFPPGVLSDNDLKEINKSQDQAKRSEEEEERRKQQQQQQPVQPQQTYPDTNSQQNHQQNIAQNNQPLDNQNQNLAQNHNQVINNNNNNNHIEAPETNQVPDSNNNDDSKSNSNEQDNDNNDGTNNNDDDSNDQGDQEDGNNTEDDEANDSEPDSQAQSDSSVPREVTSSKPTPRRLSPHLAGVEYN